MQYDFDEVINRRGTQSAKWDSASFMGYDEDILPMWVADMDFRSPKEVVDALTERAQQGIYGYSSDKPGAFETVCSWFERRHGWKPSPDWIVQTPGVVYALGLGVRATTKPGDSVLIQPPVYYPFSGVINGNERKLIENDLVYKDGRYTMDLDDFERKIVDEDVKAFIICSPHNPVSRVWTLDELQSVGKICKQHGVVVISDEIHCDFTFPGHEHTMFLKACPDMADLTILCTAPSKTFNLAGLQGSNIFIPNEDLRKRFAGIGFGNGYVHIGCMAAVAMEAAYSKGDEWVDQLLAYLAGNLDFMRSYFAESIPKIKMIEPDGTYLIWLDCSELGLADDKLDEFMAKTAKVWFDAGTMFGGNGGQFERINIACPRATLAEGLERVKKAVDAL